jgi:hypothetical protein
MTAEMLATQKRYRCGLDGDKLFRVALATLKREHPELTHERACQLALETVKVLVRTHRDGSHGHVMRMVHDDKRTITMVA